MGTGLMARVSGSGGGAGQVEAAALEDGLEGGDEILLGLEEIEFAEEKLAAKLEGTGFAEAIADGVGELLHALPGGAHGSVLVLFIAQIGLDLFDDSSPGF